MDLKCKEKLIVSPSTLKEFALAKWINTRHNWDPMLALHMCKASRQIKEIVFDCDCKTIGKGLLYTYNNLEEIIAWEKKKRSLSLKSRHDRWLSKNFKRNLVTVHLQDDIYTDHYPYKKYKHE